MNRFPVYIILIFMAAGSVLGQGSHRGLERLHDADVVEGAAAITAELYDGMFLKVVAEGSTPIFDEAMMTTGEVVDDNGNPAIAQFRIVPFVNSASGKRGYFTRLSLRSMDGALLSVEESIVYDSACACSSNDIRNTSSEAQGRFEAEGLSLSSDLQKVISWIRAGKISSLRSWLSAQAAKGVASSILANLVKMAFEKTGHYCPKLKPGVPKPYLVYLVTCYKVAY